MAAPAAVLSILVRANTGPATTALLRVNQQLDATDKHGQKVARTMERVAAGIALVGGTAVVGGLAYAAKKAADFEQQMSALGSVADASAKQMERFRKQALKAGADTKFSALEAAEAQTELAKGGLNVKQIMGGGLRSALALAAAGEMELADAASATANAINLFGLRGRDSIKVADMLAQAANATTADVADFAMALTQGGAVAKSAGLSFRETVLALEALAKSGVKNSDAGTSLKTALIQLIKPTAKQKELADKLNLSFVDQHGKIKSLADISSMLRGRLGDQTKAQRTATLATLAGTDGVRTLTALYDAGAGRLNRWEKGLAKQGTAADVARRKQDNLKGSLEQLQGSFETLAIQVGTSMIPTVRDAADDLTGLANDIGRIVDRDDLSLGEKLQRSLDLAQVRLEPWADKFEAAIDRANIPDKLGDAISAATPVIAKMAAQAGIAAAKTFAGAFAESDIWGKLVLGGWLLSRLGGRAGFFKMGAEAGGAFGAGMAAGGAGGGLVGRLKGALKGLGGLAARFVALDVAINLVDSKGNPIAAAINTAHDLTFGLVPKVKIQSGQERAEASVAAVGKELDAAFASKNIGAIQRVTDKIRGMAAEAREYKEVGLAKELDKLSRRGDANVASIAEIADQQRRAASMSGRFADAIKGLRLRGSKDFEGLVRQVTFGSRQILRVGGEKSEQTQQAITKQFRIARDRVREAMHDKVVSVKRGTSLLHDLAVKELALYGIKAGRVDVVLAKGAKGQMRPTQHGGYLEGGKPTGDSIPVLAERGEYVINRRAVRKVGKKNLDRLNFGAAPRFQTGGMVDPAWDPGNQRLAAGISGRVGAWARRFQADMTAGYDPGGGHVSPGHNITGTATDMVPLAGNWDLLEKGLRVLTAAGLKVLYGSNGVGIPWPNHGRGNHAHIEWGTGAGIPGFGGLTRVLLQGPASVALEAGQGALDRIRGAADAAINRALAFSGESLERGFGSPSATGSGSDLMRAISRSRGWNFGDWWALDAAETSHGANLTNPNSTARLRGQFLDSNWGRYGPGSDPRANPSMAQQIQAMAAYISERYGNPTAAWAFHRAHNFYRQGGLVGRHGAINQTLRKVRSGSPKLRQRAVKGLLERIKGVGLPEKLQGELKKFSTDANVFGEYADRAGALSSEDTAGNPIFGLVGGRSQSEWLTSQLEALFNWRNAIVRAEKVVQDRREKIAAAIAMARKRLEDARGQIAWIGRTRKKLQNRLDDAQKHPRQNRALIRGLRGKIRELNKQERPIERSRAALHDKILPALTGKRSALTTTRGTLLENLEEVQGIGSPMGVLGSLPPLGVLGGRIFDTQMQLRDLNAPREPINDGTSDTGAERTSILEELLRQANLRTAVSEAQFRVFRDFPQFGGGGIVPGPSGAAVPAVVHGREGVFTPEQMAAMGGAGNVRVIVHGDIVSDRRDPVEVLIGDRRFDAAVERATRRQTRRAPLPGAGGGGLR